MRLSILTAGAASALLLCGAPAMAQTTTPPGHTQMAPGTQSGASNQSSYTAMRAQVRDMLQKAGYRDIRVMTGSLLIKANDKDGNPVVMSLSPDSFTEVAEVGSSPSGSNDEAGATNTSTPSGSTFVSIPNDDALSSNLVGLDVYNNSNKDIGQIKDVAMNQRGRAQAYILSVGGFLRIGEHYVAVNPSEVKISYNDSDKKWHATMNATTSELKAAPEFKYNGRWNASKS
jgi:sporulation protein YlmC with PRC-barrel domain